MTRLKATLASLLLVASSARVLAEVSTLNGGSPLSGTIILAAITDPDVARKILESLALPARAPPLAEPRILNDLVQTARLLFHYLGRQGAGAVNREEN